MSLLEQFVKTNDLPEKYKTMNQADLEKKAKQMIDELGSKVYIPGHHYQKDEVIQFAHDKGDSLQLAQISAKNTEAEYIIFCGVHFMAETADILTSEDQKVILPDMRAGCSMADMANLHQLERAWPILQETFGDTIIPMTYVNSTAEIKAFCGRHGGATVTSSNADKMMRWAFTQKKRILFLPDQHLGRNTGAKMGIPLKDMVVWNPIQNNYEGEASEETKVILWKGHCSVHEKFTLENINSWREKDPKIQILVHPECSYDVVEASDYAGSTQYIIKKIEEAEAGTHWAIGTEMNLVQRLKQDHPELTIHSLNTMMCACLTMNRIDLPHFTYALEKITEGDPQNIIKVPNNIAKEAKLALDRMLVQS
ncbi:quinolinate synthase NadA [Terrilactibacillus laevilacticus]|uniref:Quinolinate synthase n=1 Tax=Terrilactibacillus laevilacticus TaxID=1380157 RepID=A0ABW5PSN0_9BACI|nr:quinolinate synthase NadA [Terrilactibacillus laevilacticus]